MTTTPQLLLTLMVDNQNGAEILFNEALLALDAIVGGGQVTEATAPPGSPTNGTTRLVIATATGTFTGKEGKLAVYWDGAWKFFTVPLPGHWSTTEVRAGLWRDGEEAYQKVVDLSSGPNATVKSVAHGISGLDLAKPITFECSAYSSTAAHALPGPGYFDPNTGQSYQLRIDGTNVLWEANFDMTGYTMKVRLRYCK